MKNAQVAGFPLGCKAAGFPLVGGGGGGGCIGVQDLSINFFENP